MIEAVIAMMIMVIGALATFGLVDAATHNTFRAQQSQVLNDRLQAEIGQIRQLPYNQVALTSAPTHSSVSTDPNFRVTGSTFAINRDGTGAEALDYNGGTSHDQGVTTVSAGTVDPGPTPFTTGDVTGKVYRYVTWQQDTSCTNCGQPWVKHVTVIATIDSTASGATRAYQEIQTDIQNPAANVNTGGPSGGGSPGNPTPWTFWLTDTPCNNNSRQPITADHLTHNTRGICSAGLKTGNSPGAPDLMFTEAPPCSGSPPDCNAAQPLYDYATDVEPASGGANDRGVQLRNSSGCSNIVSGNLGTVFGTLPLVPDVLDPTLYQEVHKWLAPPIPTGYDIVFNGQGELDLWTRSLNGAVQPGKICVFLFYRQLVGAVYVDTPAANLDLGNLTYFTYSQNPWPTNWTEIHVPLHFNLGAHLTPTTQLGVALSVDNSGTGAGGLEFLYDAPSFDSRLQLQTSSILPF